MSTENESLFSSAVCAQPVESDITEINSSQVKRKTKHELQGGFDCLFVEEPPKHLLTDCSICLCVLKDPYLVDCCGISFCQSCIKPIEKENKPCPVCNMKFATCIPDKRLQRTLNEMKVYCCHKELGCEWIGGFGKLSQHLSTEVETNDSCLFISIECVLCGKSIQRQHLEKHKSNKCPKRPYSCDYCNDYESTCEDVTTNHWPVCPSRQVPCPNQCGVYPERQNLDSHIDKECPLAVIECSFSYAGCREKLCRKDMQDHIVNNLAKHMSLQAISYQQTIQSLKSENTELRNLILGLEKKLKEQETNLEVTLTQLQEEKQALEEQLEDQAAQIDEQQWRTINSFHQINEQQKRLIEPLYQHTMALDQQMKVVTIQQIEVNSHIGIAPLDLTLTEFSKLKRSKKSWSSKPFYSHSQGYKLRLSVFPNGAGEGTQTHTVVCIYLMKGEFDDALQWPICEIINILILSHDAINNYLCQIRCSNETSAEVSRGWGQAIAIDHATLEAYFLASDCLRFRISRVK